MYELLYYDGRMVGIQSHLSPTISELKEITTVKISQYKDSQWSE
jgi:hypothetical protein